MKKTVFFTTMLALSGSYVYTPVAQAEDADALRICEYISVNDSKRLRKFLKSRKLKIRNVFDSLKCNDDNLLIFAAKSNALDAGELIISKISKKSVAQNIDAIAAHSAHLAAKAKNRVK
jgi:hypothetical protein